MTEMHVQSKHSVVKHIASFKMHHLFSPVDKPSILQLSSACAVKDSEVLCHCLVNSEPKATTTWSVNGTLPPPDYNLSITSDSDTLTASLRGRMDRPLRVICFAFNSLGNDSLVLLQGEEGAFKTLSLLPTVRKATLFLLFIHCDVKLLSCLYNVLQLINKQA